MRLGTITKQPVDRQSYFVDYAGYLQDEEVVVGATMTVDILGELYIIQPVVVPGGKSVEFWLEAGVNGSVYALEITANTSKGNIKQDEIRVKVKEVQ